MGSDNIPKEELIDILKQISARTENIEKTLLLNKEELKDEIKNIKTEITEELDQSETKLEETKSVLNIISGNFELDCSYSDLRDVYRIGNKQSDRTRPLVIEFVNYQLKFEILANSKKLKGTSIYVQNDYIQEDYKNRKLLIENLKLARSNNLKTTIRNNRLVVEGEEFTVAELEKRNTETQDKGVAAQLEPPCGIGKTKPTKEARGEQSNNKVSFAELLHPGGKKRKEQPTESTNQVKRGMDKIIIGQLNIRSLFPKLEDLKNIFLSQSAEYSIFCITETWISPDITDSMLKIENYKLYRADRRVGRGGGVCMYIKESAATKQISPINTEIEQLWIYGVKFKKQIYAIGTVYRPPSYSVVDFLNCLELNVIDMLPKYDEIICLGDFNIDMLRTESSATIKLNKTLESLGLVQLVSSPTRNTPTSSTLIDLILATSNDGFVNSCSVIPADRLSDHDLTSIELSDSCEI
nr:unnamed protein product [Callosobruchus chinensis]